MRTVFMLRGTKAGQFVPLPDDDAQAAIELGNAQCALTEARHIKQPQYKTREIRAEKPKGRNRNESKPVKVTKRASR